MKNVKVAFLFFTLISFLCCNKQVEIIENNLTKNSKVNTFFKSEYYQKSKKSKRLILSKKLATQTTLNSHDTYLITLVICIVS